MVLKIEPGEKEQSQECYSARSKVDKAPTNACSDTDSSDDEFEVLSEFRATERELTSELPRIVRHLVWSEVGRAMYSEDVSKERSQGDAEKDAARLHGIFTSMVLMELKSPQLSTLSQDFEAEQCENCPLALVLKDIIRMAADPWKDTLNHQFDLGIVYGEEIAKIKQDESMRANLATDM
ncbi:uncharacterized protein B0I36DRAFT_356319 [Microdochium trichocladiopsis]|uniref:Uncharacterized protein n=1 Tax=Microdochium trichocladiopsis TaxID=1682393 RepID=A0A9P9BIJ9_9PEZI|nr:uncharacterized protein B0I36DRAFT_356378 [Microdochium trichocladiopsis]XP_046004618.1 uncharacterized protein B0I36DRAFT_356319 [Microdochium trichocladiopsis]KAH7010752.1 hypothetical protein B0I36DRAFT_356378 [Microdochium trichocladiopsis]KAH7012242.1 hypothetical protein B0I36DRAFT_356319 [Microdochium trichocladiopsis]